MSPRSANPPLTSNGPRATTVTEMVSKIDETGVIGDRFGRSS
jgi:hypothetical protein